MPLPIPTAEEKEKDFIGRCMGDGVMNKEYPDGKQRTAVCYSQFRSAKKSAVLQAFTQVSKSLDRIIKAEQEEEAIERFRPELTEKAQTVGGFESPEPGDLPKAGSDLLARVYASCRSDGGDKEKCSKIAWAAVNHAGYKSQGRLDVLKDLHAGLMALSKTLTEKKARKSAVKPKAPEKDAGNAELVVERPEQSETHLSALPSSGKAAVDVNTLETVK